MTRKKKSRKGGSLAPARLSKEKLREIRAMKELRRKKTKGAKAGSRNAPDLKTAVQGAAGGAKDTRVGSKKPIPLMVEQEQSQVEMKRHPKPQVQLKDVSQPTLTPEQELAELEQDERLLKLVERHESGEMLTGKDAKYFNAKVARHQQLCEILGIEDEEFEDEDYESNEEFDSYISNDLADEWLSDDDEEDKS